MSENFQSWCRVLPGGREMLATVAAAALLTCAATVSNADDANDILKAIDLALSGEWEAAHEIVQQHEDSTAAWIHAVLHKIEGDAGNSRYWYHRAGKLEHFPDEPKRELEEIRNELAGQA